MTPYPVESGEMLCNYVFLYSWVWTAPNVESKWISFPHVQHWNCSFKLGPLKTCHSFRNEINNFCKQHFSEKCDFFLLLTTVCNKIIMAHKMLLAAFSNISTNFQNVQGPTFKLHEIFQVIVRLSALHAGYGYLFAPVMLRSFGINASLK